MTFHAILAASAAAMALSGTTAAAQGASASTLAGRIDSQCSRIEYEDDCFSALRRALSDAAGLPAEELAPIGETVAQAIADNPNQADDIREIVSESGVDLGEL